MIDQRLEMAGAELARADEFDHAVISGTREEDWRRVQAIYDAAKNE